MPTVALALAFALIGQIVPPEMAVNPIFQDLLDRGIEANGVRVALPAPKLADGADPAASRAVLQAIAGDERSIINFTRDSVTAPFVLQTHDTRAVDATVRAGDLYFVIHADLAAIDLRPALGKTGETTTEAGNMRFTAKLIPETDLNRVVRDRLAPTVPGRDEWFTQVNGRLLDRIRVESTSRAVSTRTPESLTVAMRTGPPSINDPVLVNRWATLSRLGSTETAGPPQPYPGGGSYVKITRLAAVPGALLIEGHFAFVEPDAWFDRNPILRSKFSLICQDQVRQLRREIQKRQGGK